MATPKMLKKHKETPHLAIAEMLQNEGGGPLGLDVLAVYVVQSSSDPMDYHTVLHLPGDVYDCNCRGGRYTGTCPGIRAVHDAV